MHLAKLSFHSNPNIGLYVYATDKYALIGSDVPMPEAKIIEEALKVPCHRLSIAGTSLLGVFLAGNSSCLLVPKIVFEHEIMEIKKLGIHFEIIDTDLTALGNNLFANDFGAIVNTEFSEEEITQIKNALKVVVRRGKIEGLDTVGSLAVHNSKGALVSANAESFELNFIEDSLKIKPEKGTINMGNPYLSSGIIVNSKGLLVGNLSSGVEITQADEALGFL